MTTETLWHGMVDVFESQPDSPFINKVGEKLLKGQFIPEESIRDGVKIDYGQHFESQRVERISMVFKDVRTHLQLIAINGDDAKLYLILRDIYREQNPTRGSTVGTWVADAFVIDTKEDTLVAGAAFIHNEGLRTSEQYAHIEYMKAEDTQRMNQLLYKVNLVLDRGKVIVGHYDENQDESDYVPEGPVLTTRGG